MANTTLSVYFMSIDPCRCCLFCTEHFSHWSIYFNKWNLMYAKSSIHLNTLIYLHCWIFHPVFLFNFISHIASTSPEHSLIKLLIVLITFLSPCSSGPQCLFTLWPEWLPLPTSPFFLFGKLLFIFKGQVHMRCPL